MSIDPLEVAHDVEEELAHFDVFRSLAARAPKIFFGCSAFDLAKDLFFAKELSGSPYIFCHEHGRRPTGVVYQSVNHVADLLPACFRKTDAVFDALGG